MIELYTHQQERVNLTRGAFRQHRRVLLQSPTGSGKTVMATHMTGSAISRGNPVYFICHRRELIDQTAVTYRKADLPFSFVAAGMDYNPECPIQICSIDTLKNRLDVIPEPKLVIWDEAQHLGAAGWAKTQEAWQDAFHLGLSATPERLDGKGLDQYFDYLVPGHPVSWLIDQGYLADYRLYSVPGVDMSGVHRRAGDFIATEAAEAMSKPSVTGSIITHWQKLAAGRKTIGFAPTVAYSERICAEFRAAGIPAAHLDGKTPKEERRETLQRLAKGDIDIVFNVGLFAEGFDIAANSGMDVTIGCMIDASPTQALGSWLQRCGRALRKQPGQAIILDHSGNALRHGMPDDDRTWSLQGRDKKQRQAESDGLQLRQCDKCYHVHRPAPVCPLCGNQYQTKGRTIEEREGELVELEKRRAKVEAKREQGQANTLDELIELGIKRGYKNPETWAAHIYTARASGRGPKYARR